MPADIPWDRGELVLALDLFLRHGAHPADQHVSKLSRELRALGFHPGEARPDNHRSPDAVAMKLPQFAVLARTSPASAGRGSSKALEDVWAEFGRDSRRVWEEAQRVRERYAPPPSDGA